MKKLVDISFNADNDLSDPNAAIEKYKEGIHYVHYFESGIQPIIVRHINYKGRLTGNGISYLFHKGKNNFFYIPLSTLINTRNTNPDFVIVQGHNTPFQVIALRMFLRAKTKIIVNHHGTAPLTGIKKIFQQIADRCIAAYLFTALGNAEAWLDSGIIKNRNKCYEVLEASSSMKKLNKRQCRETLQIGSADIFLWVARLDKEKGPVTVLHGFEKYLHTNPQAKLYMIYHVETLLPEVRAIISSSSLLKEVVHLVGKIEHNQLATWFSAADYYVSGSVREVAGYALIESMACGCIPVVTNIPPFKKITGPYGFLFNPGDVDSLYQALIQASKVPKENRSLEITDHFDRELSFKKIAEDTYRVCKTIMAENS